GNVEHMTRGSLARLPEPPDDHRMAPDRLVRDDLVESRPERILAEHADDERRRRIRKRVRGPSHELAEVEEKNRLDLVFARGPGASGWRPNPGNRERRRCQERRDPPENAPAGP